MKKFEFRLDSALRWRKTQLQLEKAKLQNLLAEQQRVRREIEALQQERLATVAGLQALTHIEATDLRSLASYQVGVELKTARLQEQLKKRNELVLRQQSCVRDAELQVRLLEKLKEKKKTEWKFEFEKDLENNAAEAWLASHFGPK